MNNEILQNIKLAVTRHRLSGSGFKTEICDGVNVTFIGNHGVVIFVSISNNEYYTNTQMRGMIKNTFKKFGYIVSMGWVDTKHRNT